MQLTESSIFINLKRLRVLLYQAQFHMTKTDRVIYGTPLMNACGEALGAFVVAFASQEDKLRYMNLCVGWFTRLRVDLEFCVQENIIKFAKRRPQKDGNGNEIPFDDPRDQVSPRKIELFELVATIDSDMCKWRASLSKGKTLCD